MRHYSKGEDSARSEFEIIFHELTPKQRKFVDYLDEGLSGTEAALRSGYGGKNKNRDSAAVASSRLLKNDKIIAYRRARANIIYDSLGLSKETLTSKLFEVYKHALKSGRPETRYDPETRKFVETGVREMDGDLAFKVLSKIGESLGMFETKQTVSVGGALEEYLKTISEKGDVNY